MLAGRAVHEHHRTLAAPTGHRRVLDIAAQI